jgi:hypothetical protein
MLKSLLISNPEIPISWNAGLKVLKGHSILRSLVKDRVHYLSLLEDLSAYVEKAVVCEFSGSAYTCHALDPESMKTLCVRSEDFLSQYSPALRKNVIGLLRALFKYSAGDAWLNRQMHGFDYREINQARLTMIAFAYILVEEL